MKIILLQDVQNVGRKHDVKEVHDGYARNFLFARGLAKPATEQALKTLAAEKVRAEREKSEEYQKYKAVVDKLKTIVLQFKVKLGEKGRAFGSVTAVKIRDALKREGIVVEKEWIVLEDSIKTTGERTIAIKLPSGLRSEVKVRVEAE